jgi:hypothetical protein
MARADIINRLYSAHRTPLEFKFQNLVAPPLLSLLSPYDIKLLNDLARDPKLSAKINLKLDYIKSILTPRGFVKFHSGTNRVVYRFLEDQSFLIKIGLDKSGLSDSPMEYQNQFLLAPFVTRVFEVSPCGTVGLFERVEPITSRQEFISIAEDVFDLLNDRIIGEYVLEDIGTQYFMNYGMRVGFGPVLLDFPYCYKLDGNKLYCNNIDPHTGIPCGGSIDYDNGFNNLVCTKCGAKVFAKDLKQDIQKQKIVLRGRKEHSTMKVVCEIKGQEDFVKDTTISAKTYAESVKKSKSEMKVEIFSKPVKDYKEQLDDYFKERKEKQPTLEVSVNMSKEENENKEKKYEPARKECAPYKKQESNYSDEYIKMNSDDDSDQEEEQPTQNIEDKKPEKPQTKSTRSPKKNIIKENTTEIQSKGEVVGVNNINSNRDYEGEVNSLIPDFDSDNGGKYPAKPKRKK